MSDFTLNFFLPEYYLFISEYHIVVSKIKNCWWNTKNFICFNSKNCIVGFTLYCLSDKIVLFFSGKPQRNEPYCKWILLLLLLPMYKSCLKLEHDCRKKMFKYYQRLWLPSFPHSSSISVQKWIFKFFVIKRKRKFYFRWLISLPFFF